MHFVVLTQMLKADFSSFRPLNFVFASIIKASGLFLVICVFHLSWLDYALIPSLSMPNHQDSLKLSRGNWSSCLAMHRGKLLTQHLCSVANFWICSHEQSLLCCLACNGRGHSLETYSITSKIHGIKIVQKQNGYNSKDLMTTTKFTQFEIQDF